MNIDRKSKKKPKSVVYWITSISRCFNFCSFTTYKRRCDLQVSITFYFKIWKLLPLFFPLLSPREYSHKFAFQLKGQERKNVAKSTFTRFILTMTMIYKTFPWETKKSLILIKKEKKHWKWVLLKTYNNCYYVNLWHIILFKRYDEHASTVSGLESRSHIWSSLLSKNPLASPWRLMLIALWKAKL